MPLESPLVSIIMPVYNTEKYVAETIESILSQTYKNFEFIIVNDGSTDRTDEIISNFSDSRIKYIKCEKNLGIVDVLNKALTYTTGKYISRSDADDLSSPDKLKMEVEFLETHPEFGIVGTNYQFITHDGTKGRKIDLPETNEDITFAINFINPFMNSSILARAAVMKKFGYEKSFEYAEDYRIWYQIAQESKCANLPVYSVLYRIHESNISRLNRKKSNEGVKRIQREGLQKMGIDFTEKELDIHCDFLTFNHNAFRKDEDFEALENWLVKLIDNLRAKGLIKKGNYFESMINDRWFATCLNSGHTKKLIVNKIASRSYSAYFMQLLKKARQITGVKHGM
jgi:glycosyltransferase involved in cell wall biosynthesis